MALGFGYPTALGYALGYPAFPQLLNPHTGQELAEPLGLGLGRTEI
jgi:hypothetical protein